MTGPGVVLSMQEFQILGLWMSGKNGIEISDTTGFRQQSVNKALRELAHSLEGPRATKVYDASGAQIGWFIPS